MKFSAKNFIVSTAFILIAVVVLLLAVSFALDLRTFLLRGYLRPAHFPRHLLEHRPQAATSTSGIEPWMTFDYISKVYGIKPDYFKNLLSITDPRYPMLTVRRFAADAGIPLADALDEVWALAGRSASAPSSTIR